MVRQLADTYDLRQEGVGLVSPARYGRTDYYNTEYISKQLGKEHKCSRHIEVFTFQDLGMLVLFGR